MDFRTELEKLVDRALNEGVDEDFVVRTLMARADIVQEEIDEGE